MPVMRLRLFSSVFSVLKELFPDRSNRILFVPAFLFLALFPADGFGQSLLVDESFGNSTAPGWVLQGSAQLTSGTVDPNGAGWLRLTPASNSTEGFAYLNQAVPLSSGIDIKVQYQTWGKTGTVGADGLALDLFSGAITTPTAGAFGGSLGYAQGLNGATPTPGLTGGIVGIGIDENGNFANPTENRVGGPGPEPNSITIRGPGNGSGATNTAGTAPNYGFLDTATSPFPIPNGHRGPDGSTDRRSECTDR
jgi:Bacterial lectin